MKKSFIAGLSSLALIAGLAIPTVSSADDRGDKGKLEQAKNAVQYAISEIKEACQRHDRDRKWNKCGDALRDARQAKQDIVDALEDTRDH
jgi:hypothetical protein